MKKQGRRWIGAILAMLMLVVSLYTDTSVTANAATTKASVSFANLPEGNTLKLEDTYKYDFNAKKTGTAKVVYFEVKKGANTAGVQSSNSGIVYPVTAGEFDVRVVAFSSTANRTKWLDARKKNGYVADPSAEKKYVVAASDWETITVTSETEGLGIARSQSALNKVLKNKKVTDVLIWTEAEKKFEIANKNYKSKTLTVKAPQSEVTNAGRFAQINVEQIKPATFHELAKGNKFNITAVNARVIVEKGARILELIYKPVVKAADVATSGSFNFKLEIKGTVNTVNVAPQKEEGVTEVVTPVVEIETAENSNISEVKVEESTDLKLTGEKETAVKVTVEENAGNTKLTAKVPVKADLSANTTVTLAEEAKGSEITVSKKADVEVKAVDAEKPVEDVVINVAKEAEGAKLTTEVKVEVKPEANVTIAGSAAADSTITKVEGADDVNVTIEKTDEDGNITTEVVTPTPDVTPAPEVTTTPGGSTGGNGGSGNNGGTTTKEVGAIGAVTYKIGAADAVSVSPAPTLTNDAYVGTVEISTTTLPETVKFAIAESADYQAVAEKEVTIDPETKTGIFTANLVPLTTKANTIKETTVKIDVTVKVENDSQVTAPATISFTVSGSSVAKEDVSITNNAGTAERQITVGKTVVFAAPDGYTIKQGANITFSEEGTKTAELVVTKGDKEFNITITFTVVKDSTETDPKEENITVTLNGTIVVSGSAIATSGTSISVSGDKVAIKGTIQITTEKVTGTVTVTPTTNKTANVTLSTEAKNIIINGATATVTWTGNKPTSIGSPTDYTFEITVASTSK